MLVIDRQDAMIALEKLYIHLEDAGQIVIPLFIPREQSIKYYSEFSRI
jgi:hypothetical protein